MSQKDEDSIRNRVKRIEQKLQTLQNNQESFDSQGNLQEVTKLFDLISTLTQTIDRLEAELDTLESRLSSIETLSKSS
jgi:hypothetical protein